jgi:hypothetical protein
MVVESASVCSAGSVMVIGDAGSLVPCSRRYDKRVVGVIQEQGRCGARSRWELRATRAER